MLWNDDSEKAVRHRLSQLVYQTNDRCQGRVIALEGEHLRVNAQTVATDLEVFKEMISTSDFEAACAILERGFLSAFPSRKTQAFSDWIEQQELGMRARLRNKALADWSASEAVHDWTGARSSAEALARLDPHDEAVLRRVIRTHAMGGRVGEVEAVYRSFAERADPSGGWSPQRETRNLLETVQSVGQRPARESRKAGDQGLKIPLAGRAKELSQLSRRISDNRHQDAWDIVTLSGEQGMGKTRLIEEALQGARFRGSKVMYASPGEFERDIPFSPLLEALGAPWVGPLLSSVPDPWHSHLLCLLPQFDPDADPTSYGPNVQSHRVRRLTCEALLHLFTAIAQSHDTVVVLDNLQWVDEATTIVVQYLHRRWQKGRLALVLSYRQEELGQNQNAARLVSQLEVEPDATAIRLLDLEDSVAMELVASVGSDKLAEATMKDIVALADGNPLFLVEIAGAAAGAGGSEQGFRVTPSVRQAVLRRTGGLVSSARSVMSALAVNDQPATVPELMEITGHTRHECIDALDVLYERHLVERSEDKVKIRQDIVRQAVYDQLSPTRRSQLHALTAEMLRSRPHTRRPDRIAKHYHHAGDRQLTSVYALQAAKSSATRGPGDRSRFLKLAYETSEGQQQRRLAIPLARSLHRARQLTAAMHYARKALDEGRSLSAAGSFTARLVIADSLSLLRRRAPTATLEEFADLEALAQKEQQDVALAEVLDAELRLYHREGDHKGVTRFFTRVKRLNGLRDPVANCRVLATLALQAQHGNPAEGLVCARRAVTIARKHNLHTEEMLVLQRHIAALAANGLLATDEGRTSVREAKTGARRSDDLASYLLILLELANWHIVTAGLDVATEVLEKANVLVERTDCPEIGGIASLASGNLALARRNLPAAVATLGSVVPASTGSAGEEEAGLQNGSFAEDEGQAPVPPYLADSWAGLAGNVFLESGKLRQATRVAETHAVDESLSIVAVDHILFHARLLSRKGDPARAQALLERAAAAHEGERPLHWLRLTLELVRLSRRSGNPRPGLATRARDLALHLKLPRLAHEFVPYA